MAAVHALRDETAAHQRRRLLPAFELDTTTNGPMVHATALVDASKRFSQTVATGSTWSAASQTFTARLLNDVTQHACSVASWTVRLTLRGFRWGDAASSEDCAALDVLGGEVARRNGPLGELPCAFAERLATLLRTPLTGGIDVLPALVVLQLGRDLWVQRRFREAADVLWLHGIDAMLTVPVLHDVSPEEDAKTSPSDRLRRMIIMSGVPSHVSLTEVLQSSLDLWVSCCDDRDVARDRLVDSEGMLRHMFPGFDANTWLDTHMHTSRKVPRAAQSPPGSDALQKRCERRRQALLAAREHRSTPNAPPNDDRKEGGSSGPVTTIIPQPHHTDPASSSSYVGRIIRYAIRAWRDEELSTMRYSVLTSIVFVIFLVVFRRFSSRLVLPAARGTGVTPPRRSALDIM